MPTCAITPEAVIRELKESTAHNDPKATLPNGCFNAGYFIEIDFGCVDLNLSS
jgi:hypothetical protein